MGVVPVRPRVCPRLPLGEDGLGGICDRHGILNFAVALWNGKDPILKERLFGLTNEAHLRPPLRDSFTIEIPTGSGNLKTLVEAADLIDGGLTALFRPVDGKLPADGKRIEATDDPLWSQHPTFSEYFDGNTGEGLGATHQTGWTHSSPTCSTRDCRRIRGCRAGRSLRRPRVVREHRPLTTQSGRCACRPTLGQSLV